MDAGDGEETRVTDEAGRWVTRSQTATLLGLSGYRGDTKSIQDPREEGKKEDRVGKRMKKGDN